MYRLRRTRKLQRRRRASVVAAFIAVLALAVAVPTLAAANGVDNLLNNITGGGGGTSGGGTASPSPEAGSPPNYVPPLHGTNPHGQGTDAVVDLAPSTTNPLEAYPNSGEDIIAGDSRGEQNADGTYHGRVTAANVLGITLPGLLEVQSNPGEDNVGALDPLNQLLGQLCTASTLCLSLLDMHSQTDANGSHNSFSGANLSLGGPAGIGAPISVTALNSHGDIDQTTAADGTKCQTSHGDSQVAGVVLGNAVTGISANTIAGTSDSQACSNGTSSVSQGSHVLGLNGVLAGIAVPITNAGCEGPDGDNTTLDGTPNTQPDILGLGPVLSSLGVLSLVCNASDENAGQTSNPYGVREGLTAFVLPLLGDLIKATTAGPESHAVAPAAGPTTPVAPATPPANNKKGNKGNNGNGGNNGGNGAGNGAGAAAGAAAAGNGQLAFTGADLLALGLVGGALILGGLALTTTAGRRHRRTV